VSSHEVSKNSGLQASDFAISAHVPAKKINEEIWCSPNNFYQICGELYRYKTYDKLTENIKLQEFVAENGKLLMEGNVVKTGENTWWDVHK
jgi:hypothetical protein